MNTQFPIRTLDIRHDMDKLAELVADAFANDATTLGNDFRAEIRMLKKLVPVVLLLRHVSEIFRHNFDGFVIEDQGKFISLVVTARPGAKSKRWEIGNVATHPDYRRRGQGLPQHHYAHSARPQADPGRTNVNISAANVTILSTETHPYPNPHLLPGSD